MESASTFDISTAFADVQAHVDKLSPELRILSMAIWNRPETAYEEHFAHSLLTDFLAGKGFTVTRHFHLPTAFRAEFQSAHFDPARHYTVAYLSEYDSLPVIGHACGHNLIAICGVGSALALQSLLRIGTGLEGRVICLGTPAEETSGGKIDLLNAGAFVGIDFCMMAHPSGVNITKPDFIGLLECEVEFFGKDNDAGPEPWSSSASATDAAVLLYTSLSLLRQKLNAGNQIHGVIFEAGKPQPTGKSYAKCHYYMRTPTVPEMDTLKQSFQAALDSTALICGCTVKREYAIAPFEGLISNQLMASLYDKYAQQLGFDSPDLPPSYGSTDMGNVSNNLPGLHPVYSIGESTLTLHTEDFKAAAATAYAHTATLNIAKSLAMVGVELLSNTTSAQSAKLAFSLSPASCFQKAVFIKQPNYDKLLGEKMALRFGSMLKIRPLSMPTAIRTVEFTQGRENDDLTDCPIPPCPKIKFSPKYDNDHAYKTKFYKDYLLHNVHMEKNLINTIKSKKEKLGLIRAAIQMATAELAELSGSSTDHTESHQTQKPKESPECT
ncbi:Peptidase M20 domain-containing protein 2 [Hypsibius exemplaris]|uniref:Peptidase M20 domain-containing protein 2 n=1 Tax=Hypsibius exemplaris TaxID=2072580 RepID=A0A9X6NJ69_HYPEX|nr:Peptidase M20 domain-containing protein 2 [Hypsibius exemplaris]